MQHVHIRTRVSNVPPFLPATINPQKRIEENLGCLFGRLQERASYHKLFKCEAHSNRKLQIRGKISSHSTLDLKPDIDPSAT